MTRSLLPRLVSFGLVLVLASLCTYWILIFMSRRDPAEPVAVTSTSDTAARTEAVDVAPLARLFGAPSAGVAGNIGLIGVIAEGTRGKGVAILSVEGQPAVAVRAGETLSDGTVLTEVRPESIVVRRNGVAREIALPARPTPDGLKPAR